MKMTLEKNGDDFRVVIREFQQYLQMMCETVGAFANNQILFGKNISYTRL